MNVPAGDALRRLLARDGTLWPGDQARHWLGWLDAPGEMAAGASELRDWAAETMRGYERVVLCGMGGSSLAPLVFGAAFRSERLVVLDSTDPGAVRDVPVEGSLFVVSSKSGSTVEPNVMADHFWAATGGDGRRFVAVTDPGSKLEARARDDGWLRTFAGRPDVGGRYSALSPFGVVPAALAGIDPHVILSPALALLEAAGTAAQLGQELAAHAAQGRDKLTVVASPGLETFGLWLEQLVAESTGKHGKGIVPVAGEQVGAPAVYAGDRVFVHLRADGTHDAAIAALTSAGHPTYGFNVASASQVGAEMLRFEIATAIAGHYLGIDPFDQPNVQEANDLTVALLARYEQEGRIDEPPAGSVDELLAACEAGRSYLCLQAFVTPTAETAARLAAVQTRLRDALRCAVTCGFGPRYLHSTGQLHKGGAPIGRFLQVLDPTTPDLPIPGQGATFKVLRDAQAAGDAQALSGRGLPVARVALADLERVVDDALAHLRAA